MGESEELHEFFKEKKEEINHTFRFVTMTSTLLFHTLCRWKSGIENSREKRERERKIRRERIKRKKERQRERNRASKLVKQKSRR